MSEIFAFLSDKWLGIPVYKEFLGFSKMVKMKGVPDLPVAPQDEAGLTKTFQTWPRGWLHIP